jgi:xanthine dehydrogenase small subunit
MTALQFLLNRRLCREESVPPTMTVLDWLRIRAHLTGTKEGCAEGDCGACTVVIGRAIEGGSLQICAVNSCLMMLPQIDNCAVLTVEGLAAADGKLHPVQQAMIEAEATQCGFCTPGFVMAMFAFQHTGEPAEARLIHEALAGNLCRCTGYRAIVDACRRACAADRVDLQRATAASALTTLQPCTGYHHGAQVFYLPRSLDALFAAMAQSQDAILLAGGTDLGLRVSKEREQLRAVISTAAISELRELRVTGDALEIGGAITYTEALPHLDRHFPSFGALVRRIGSRQIRNLGTFAGNLATASPIGDTLPCLIVLDATVRLASSASRRELSVESLITGYRKTALAAGEVIASVRIPLLPSGTEFAAYKLSKRFDQDISTVIGAFRLERQGGKVRDFRAAFGGMAARAQRASSIESALVRRPWTLAWLSDIDGLLARDFAPISDHRGGAAYRLRAAAGLIRRFQLETTSTDPVRVEAL